MQNFHMPRRIANLALAVLVGGCALGSPTFADQNTSSVATFSSPLSYQMYNILAAEMYAHDGNPAQAALHYLAAAEQGKDPKLAQRAAELAISAQDNQLASRALERWIKLDPQSREAMQYRILSNLRAERYDQAVKDLVAVRDDVEKREGHGFEFVVSLLALESQTGKAYETFRRYVATVDNSARAQLVLASLAINSEHFEEALKAARLAKQSGDKDQKEQASRYISKALMGLQKIDEAVNELGPVAKTTKDPELKLDYARLLILADRRSEATPLFKQLYASQPENSDILYTLGLLYLEQKEFAFAEPLIKKLLDVPGRAEEANYFMGQIYEGQKRSKDAIETYKNATQGSFGLEATGRVANLLVETDGLEAARQWLGEEVKSATNDVRKVQVLLVEGQLLHDKGKYQDAITSYDQAIGVKPDDFDALYSRSLSMERLGNFEAAEKDLRTLVKLQPDNATVLNALGYMLVVNTKRYDEAEKLISKALEIRPSDAAIMDSMGWLYFRSGKLDKAEEWLRKAYNQLKDPEVASHLVEALSANGKTAEAKTILQDMLGKFPDDELLKKVKEKLVGL
ncbi:MAG: tetratricopeptide repeat protein [Gammaproteobacteria bacterium]|nr:tetratricopeptide repeat protein [Gammaproteobacteria bacterium]MBU1724735.1 tetratricopeptide repeat protein [Gammaproteobacteria bacterium]MBU2005906.1 tetratricopeptide repeat protein [Gammaproteobacteria bacterium]